MPPNAPFIVWISRLFGAVVGGASRPARISDCCAPGLSIRNTRGLAWLATCGIVFAALGHRRRLPVAERRVELRG